MKPPRREKYEREIEKYLVRQCELNSIACLKMQKLPGIPDRILLYKGLAVFAEVKAPHGELRELQKEKIAMLIAQGFDVGVVYSCEDCDSLIYSILALA